MRNMLHLFMIGACISQIALSQMSEPEIAIKTHFSKCDTLPDLFTMFDGTKVVTRADWSKRREELRKAFQYYQYGQLPPAPVKARATEIFCHLILDKSVIYRMIRLEYGERGQITAYLYLAIPAVSGSFPVVITGDRCWYSRIDSCKQLTDRGYILAEFDRTCFDHDDSNRLDGLHPFYPQYDFGTIGAWAWGYIRIVDYLEQCPFIDKSKIILTGHSRAGKTVLLAGAMDDRIALTVPNGSGQCGSAPMRMKYNNGKSETVGDINTVFPYWFNKRFNQFTNDSVSTIPYDQHALIACIPPRAYLATYALNDEWANPKGTMLTHLEAKKVFDFLGVGERAGIHFREGSHAQTGEDWEALLDFADKVLFKKSVKRRFDSNPFGN